MINDQYYIKSHQLITNRQIMKDLINTLRDTPRLPKKITVSSNECLLSFTVHNYTIKIDDFNSVTIYNSVISVKIFAEFIQYFELDKRTNELNINM